MSYSHTIEVNVLTKLPNAHSNFSHWTKTAEKKKWVSIIQRNFIMNYPKEPLKKARVLITRFSAREPDKDNLYASCKQLIDALKKNWIIEDDSPQHIDLFCDWQREKSLSRARTKIKVEEVL